MANVKKDLSSAAADSKDVFAAIAGGEKKKPTTGKYHFSLVMPEECQPYLERAAYHASEPGHMVSINQYINDLIKLDMEKGGLIDYHKGKDSADNGGK